MIQLWPFTLTTLGETHTHARNRKEHPSRREHPFIAPIDSLQSVTLGESRITACVADCCIVRPFELTASNTIRGQAKSRGYMMRRMFLSQLSFEASVYAHGEGVCLCPCVCVCVHLPSPRYKHMHGKWLIHPVNGRRIPIICDAELVDMNFGTGAVKVRDIVIPTSVHTHSHATLHLHTHPCHHGALTHPCIHGVPLSSMMISLFTHLFCP